MHLYQLPLVVEQFSSHGCFPKDPAGFYMPEGSSAEWKTRCHSYSFPRVVCVCVCLTNSCVNTPLCSMISCKDVTKCRRQICSFDSNVLVRETANFWISDTSVNFPLVCACVYADEHKFSVVFPSYRYVSSYPHSCGFVSV